MNIDNMIRHPGEWLKGSGPRSDIVISSRVRLARNLRHYRFPPSAGDQEKAEVNQQVLLALEEASQGKELSALNMEHLSALDRRFLVERHLISRELEEGQGPRGLAVHQDESIAVMINEEDHLRLQSLKSGLQLKEAWDAIDSLDTDLSRRVEFAFDEQFGYLTACPTNVGTGLRASVMVHLPALVMTRHIEKAFRAISKLNLAVRGFYGEGTEAHGDFYQISNQITIGRSEEEILSDLQAVIDQVVSYEAGARANLLQKERTKLEDRVWRSFATLSHARIVSSEEAMRLLSAVRLGVHLELLDEIPVHTLNELFVFSQPAHLQRLEGKELVAAERDIVRASMIRERLAGAEGERPD